MKNRYKLKFFSFFLILILALCIGCGKDGLSTGGINGGSGSSGGDPNKVFIVCHTGTSSSATPPRRRHYYLSNATGTWNGDVIYSDNNNGKICALAAGNDGSIHLIYRFYFGSKMLRYTKYSAGAWSTPEEIPNTNDVVEYSVSMQIDSTNKVHFVCYDKTNKRVLYGSGKSGSFTVTPIADSTAGDDYGHYCCLAIDKNNKLHVAYNCQVGSTTKNILRYASGIGGFWNIETVDEDSNGIEVEYVSIAVDDNCHAHIAYYDSKTPAYGNNYSGESIRYATNKSGSWSTKIIEGEDGTSGGNFDTGRYPSIGVGTDGTVHVAYKDYDNSVFRYASKGSSASGFTFTNLNGNGYGNIVLAVDKNNSIHIAYGNSSNEVVYATNKSGSLVYEQPASGGSSFARTVAITLGR